MTWRGRSPPGGCWSPPSSWSRPSPRSPSYAHRRADPGLDAEAFARKWAGAGIFFRRWLVGALGLWINVTSGLSEYSWPRFLLWDVAGELLWVLLYGGLAATLFPGYRLYLAMRPSTEKDTNGIEDVPQSA